MVRLLETLPRRNAIVLIDNSFPDIKFKNDTYAIGLEEIYVVLGPVLRHRVIVDYPSRHCCTGEVRHRGYRSVMIE